MNPALRYILEGIKPLWGLRKAGKWAFGKPVTTGKARILPAETTKFSPKGRKLPKGRTRDIPARPSPVFDTTTTRAGYFRRNPGVGVTSGLGLLGAGGATAYGLLSDDDVPDDTEDKKAPPPKTVPSPEKDIVPGQREAYQKKRRKRLKKGMKQLLNQYMILSYVSPEEADNFLKAAMKMMEVDQDFNDDIYMQEAYDTVFQPGNMPATGREAFTRLLPLVGNEDAMEISGDYAALAPEYKEWQYKKKETIQMEDILRMPREQAIRALISAWTSDAFDIPENLKMVDVRTPEGEKEWVAYADAYLNMMQSGVGTTESSGQILSDTLTAPAP